MMQAKRAPVAMVGLSETGACRSSLSSFKMGGRVAQGGQALPAIKMIFRVIRGVGSSTVVPGSVGSYRPVIAGAKLREGTTTILPRGGERSRESACLQCGFTTLAGGRRRQRWTRNMVHGKNRIPCWIDRRLTGLAGPKYGCHHLVWAAH